MPPKVLEVVTSEFSSHYPSSKTDLQKLNDDFLKEHKDSAQHQLAGLQVRQFLDNGSRETNEKDVLGLIGKESTEMADAVRAVEIVKEWGGDPSEVLAQAAKRWPEADAFQVNEKKRS